MQRGRPCWRCLAHGPRHDHRRNGYGDDRGGLVSADRSASDEHNNGNGNLYAYHPKPDGRDWDCDRYGDRDRDRCGHAPAAATTDTYGDGYAACFVHRVHRVHRHAAGDTPAVDSHQHDRAANGHNQHNHGHERDRDERAAAHGNRHTDRDRAGGHGIANDPADGHATRTTHYFAASNRGCGGVDAGRKSG